MALEAENHSLSTLIVLSIPTVSVSSEKLDSENFPKFSWAYERVEDGGRGVICCTQHQTQHV